VQRATRLLELHPLDTIRGKDRDLLAIKYM
jgi:hypothetical protein